jgi:5'-nucleotidase
MRILITNDDGIDAPGLAALRAALAPLGEVQVVAPERPRSACGHSVTLHKPLRLTESRLSDGAPGWASNGMPTDCVSLGYDVLFGGRVDLVVCGINDGANLGWDITYSGTVMAAMEGVILGVPAIAVSVATETGGWRDYAGAAAVARYAAEMVLAHGLPPGSLLNINVPPAPAEEFRGVRITRQGRREYVDRIETRDDPTSRPYYWLKGRLKDDPGDEDSDVRAIRDRYISVTPIQLDMTATHLMDGIRQWWRAARPETT